MKPNPLVARMLAQRNVVCDLGDGLKVTLRRPPESELPSLRERKPVEVVQEAAVAWDGFTEATLLGEGIGASDPAPFDAEVWAVWVADNTEAIAACWVRLWESVSAHLERVKATQGN